MIISAFCYRCVRAFLVGGGGMLQAWALGIQGEADPFDGFEWLHFRKSQGCSFVSPQVWG